MYDYLDMGRGRLEMHTSGSHPGQNLGFSDYSLDRSVQAQKAVRRQERRRTSEVEVRPVCYPFIREAAIMRGSEE